MDDRRRRQWVVHPLLFAAFPVLFLFATNLHQGLTPGNLAGPLAVVVGGAAVLFLILGLAVRNAPKGGLIVSLLVLMFFSYGYLYLAVRGFTVLGVTVGRHLYLLPTWAIVAAGIVWPVVRARGRLPRLTQTFNVVAAGLVLLNAINIGWYQYRAGRVMPVALHGGDVRLPPVAASERPDIYYIVLEEYGGVRALRSQFGFDNRPFLDALEQRGFFVADRGTANYPHTPLSLASSLNMRYLDQPTGSGGGDNLATLVDLIEDNETARVLKARGYRFIEMGSWWTPTATSPLADVNLHIGGPSEFTQILEQTTAIAPLATDDFRLRQWKRVRFQFDVLPGLARYGSPRFVFAHITVPHAPYVFDARGRYLTREDQGGRTIPQLYIEQLRYTNASVLRLLDRLLAEPEGERPVIVLQSDEGPYEGESPGWEEIVPRIVQRKFGILNAYYLPGGDPSYEPYPTITPVNSFRLLFDRYFRAGLPLLPDRDFLFRSIDGIYHFADVTGVVEPLT